eukprot:s552_g39.t1
MQEYLAVCWQCRRPMCAAGLQGCTGDSVPTQKDSNGRNHREATGICTASLDRPLACTLAEWHMMDVKDQSFGFFSPNREPLLEHEQRESFQYGYGFSFVYTKAAWELVKFPDTEWSEDGEPWNR